MTLTHKTYEVSVQGFPAVTYSAHSPAAARASAWRDYTNAYECTFKQFLGISSVRRCPVPEADGYDYIRRAYGVQLKVGQRVKLRGEGLMNGKAGTVIYPGKCTAHVMILLDGDKAPVAVHPDNFEPEAST